MISTKPATTRRASQEAQHQGISRPGVLEDTLSLTDQLARRLMQLEAMQGIARAILAMEGPEAGFAAALEHLASLAPCCACGVLLLDRNRTSLTLVAADETGNALLPTGTTISLTGFAGAAEFLRALSDEGVHQVEDVEAAMVRCPWLAEPARKGIRTVLSVSLAAHGDLLGVLCLGSDEQDAFSAEDRMIVEEVADLLAIAVHQAQLFQDLIISRTQLRLLARQAVSAREAERQRIATILHNDTGQTLAVLAINLSLIERNLPDDCPQVMLRVARAGAMVEEIAAQTRALARSLRPPSLDHVGLHATLQAYCQELAAETQLAIEYRGTPDLPDLSPAAQICLYRCLQEALTNVLKHAGASQVQAELSIRPAQGQVCLAVQDNGRGFRAADELLTGGIWTQGSGLLALREWLDSLNGELRVSSQPGQGCLLEALVPVTTGVLP